MLPQPSKAFLIVPVFLVLAFPAKAETIKLKSGQTIHAKVLKEDKDSIVVDAGIDTPVTYFLDEIKEILPDEELPAPPVDPKIGAAADVLESQALDLIDAQKMEEGLALMRQAIAQDPNPTRYMNYGSVLFGNGVELFKNGLEDQGKKVLRQSEEQLNKAIAGFDKTRDNLFLSQAYFLLGEMYRNAFGDPAKAKELYTQCLAFADHDGAKAALAQMQ